MEEGFRALQFAQSHQAFVNAVLPLLQKSLSIHIPQNTPNKVA
jgi:hypothetical protein